MNLGRNAATLLSIVLLSAVGSWAYLEWPQHHNHRAFPSMNPETRQWFHTIIIGDTVGAAALLKSDPSLLCANLPERGTALHFAAMRDDADMIEFLLGRGADPMARGRWGGTPLHIAAYWGNANAVAVLVRKTPVETPCLDFKCTPLFWAAWASGQDARPDGDYVGVSKLLLEAGAGVDPSNGDGQRAVTVASPSVAALLIASGAAPPPATQPTTQPSAPSGGVAGAN